MIIYHPAYDVNHCLYRILLGLETSVHKEFDWSLFRLMDFYVLFPHLLKEIKPFPVALQPFKKIVKSIPDSYENLPNTKRILFELEAIQNSAVQNLMAKGLVSVSKFEKQIIARTTEGLPESLSEKLSSDSRVDEEWYRLVVNELPLSEFEGKKGLKARSKLMEYKYDA